MCPSCNWRGNCDGRLDDYDEDDGFGIVMDDEPELVRGSAQELQTLFSGESLNTQDERQIAALRRRSTLTGGTLTLVELRLPASRVGSLRRVMGGG